MQPLVHATRRTPGPSTVDPVVNEWRNPISPVASATRTSASGTAVPRLTRSSNGFFAASGVDVTAGVSGMDVASVECSIDDVHLLLAREPHEIDRVARHPNRQVGIFLGVLHCIEEHVAVQ